MDVTQALYALDSSHPALSTGNSETQEGKDLAAAAAAPAAAGSTTRLGGGSFAEVQGLEHHWAQLGAERKTSFAQMAGLTR